MAQDRHTELLNTENSDMGDLKEVCQLSGVEDHRDDDRLRDDCHSDQSSGDGRSSDLRQATANETEQTEWGGMQHSDRTASIENTGRLDLIEALGYT